MIGICSAAAIQNIESEPESKVQGNAIEEPNENDTSDLETAEGKHFGIGPRVLVVNKGYGGGYHRGGGCGCSGGHSRYHSHHRFYGKKK